MSPPKKISSPPQPGAAHAQEAQQTTASSLGKRLRAYSPTPGLEAPPALQLDASERPRINPFSDLPLMWASAEKAEEQMGLLIAKANHIKTPEDAEAIIAKITAFKNKHQIQLEQANGAPHRWAKLFIDAEGLEAQMKNRLSDMTAYTVAAAGFSPPAQNQ
jgi:hypothetical protein